MRIEHYDSETPVERLFADFLGAPYRDGRNQISHFRSPLCWRAKGQLIQVMHA